MISVARWPHSGHVSVDSRMGVTVSVVMAVFSAMQGVSWVVPDRWFPAAETASGVRMPGNLFSVGKDFSRAWEVAGPDRNATDHVQSDSSIGSLCSGRLRWRFSSRHIPSGWRRPTVAWACRSFGHLCGWRAVCPTYTFFERLVFEMSAGNARRKCPGCIRTSCADRRTCR